MVDIIHRVGINAAAGDVHRALATIEGLSGWWTTETTGDADVGGAITFDFTSPAGAGNGHVVATVTDQTAELVRWRVTEGPADWIGTDIEFALSPHDGGTIVLFGHRNWREASESMAHCSMKWATFMLSLRQLVETGSGRPAPGDLKIDNWN